MSLSTHVLDTSTGRPAADLEVRLYRHDGDSWRPVVARRTDADGRVGGLPLRRGPMRLEFATGPWWAARGVAAFHPEVAVTFEVTGAAEPHHVPLLLSPFAYSTYRGS